MFSKLWYSFEHSMEAMTTFSTAVVASNVFHVCYFILETLKVQFVSVHSNVKCETM